MFGRKAKHIKELEQIVRDLLDLKQKRESLIGELRQILDCQEAEDIRVKARAIMLMNQTNINLVVGAAHVISKADKWFASLPQPKEKGKKKS